MDRRKCANPACRDLFVPNRRNRNHRYCSRKQCQRMRKAKWQRQKRAGDHDYRKNQADAQARWTADNPGYWKRYRAANPEYEKRNRQKQKERDRCKRSTGGLKPAAALCGNLAKMDASSSDSIIKTGTYRLIPVHGDTLAKMDAITIEITAISVG